MTAAGARVTDAVDAFRRGEIVVVTDDDDRENEGDLILAAAHATPEKLAFIIRNTSGIVCAPITGEIAARLNLSPMVAQGEDPRATTFTVSVDIRGATTGISAEERAKTTQRLAAADASPSDFVRPGHVFPLIAREGGVLTRSGHTEAAVDLCQLAGLPPVGVICELVNDDGTVMRGPDVAKFAEAKGLVQVSVAEIIALRQQREQLVKRVEEQAIETAAGPAKAITYATPWDPMQHLAVVIGDIGDGKSLPVRIHREQLVEDIFGRSPRLQKAIDKIAAEGRGVLIYLREGAVGVSETGLSERDRMQAASGEAHESARHRAEDWREIGLGAQILRDLGVSSIRLFAAREFRYVGLKGFGIEIEATERL
jgi:3,4-dihydroxy 2-butanone 4-phosphate synthase/GTP cyclohydrolase II